MAVRTFPPDHAPETATTPIVGSVELFEAFFEERSRIPPGCDAEVAFEELEKNPIAEILVAGSFSGFLDLLEQPRPRVSPPTFGGGFGDAENLSGLVDFQPDEIPQFDQFGLLGFEFGEAIQGVV